MNAGLCAELNGGVAQLVERLLCKQEVVGSIPSASIVLGGCGVVGAVWADYGRLWCPILN